MVGNTNIKAEYSLSGVLYKKNFNLFILKTHEDGIFANITDKTVFLLITTIPSTEKPMGFPSRHF
jgi:hypothetical protein